MAKCLTGYVGACLLLSPFLLAMNMMSYLLVNRNMHKAKEGGQTSSLTRIARILPPQAFGCSGGEYELLANLKGGTSNHVKSVV